MQTIFEGNSLSHAFRTDFRNETLSVAGLHQLSVIWAFERARAFDFNWDWD